MMIELLFLWKQLIKYYLTYYFMTDSLGVAAQTNEQFVKGLAEATKICTGPSPRPAFCKL